MPPQIQEIISIEGSITYLRENYGVLYPTKPKQRKHTFGNIPEGLHTLITAFASARNLTVAQSIAALWDLYTEYEAEFEDELTAQRSNKTRRV